jgi:lipopolysaccharide/colanic/teichoic acid biosynthesis glycosyltransferase
LIIRIFDIVFALIGLIVLGPFLILLSIWISLDSSGGPFFKQKRVGKNGVEFQLYKFRSMRPLSESAGQLTVGMKDPRITRVGALLRKFKLDELPQLINVLKGDMSLVGPRPEVPKYVALYSESQRAVLNVRPGVTDEASLKYFDENRLLALSDNPEETYINEVMPNKLALNMAFVNDPSLSKYLMTIYRTVKKIIE